MCLLCSSFYFCGCMIIAVATVGDLCYLCLYHLNYDETSLVILYNSLPHRDALYRLKIVNRADPDQTALVRAA